MPANPFEPPQEVNVAWRPAPAQLPWALAGLVAGLAIGPVLAAALIVEMHEYHDPPLAVEFARAWPTLPALLGGIAGVFGALTGALARNLLFWRRL